MNTILYLLYILIFVYLIRKTHTRLQLSMAKHPSIAGHSKLSRRIARLLPAYHISADKFYSIDGAPEEIQEQRKSSIERLATYFSEAMPQTIAAGNELKNSVSDVDFTHSYRVPFQYANFINSKISYTTIVTETCGTRVKDLDNNCSFDLTGSYGVNLFGYEFYKQCLNEAHTMVQNLGPVLGAYHPVIIENTKFLKDISGMDEVSYHMSGTEAVMQAVRLARYHTGKSHLVRFCGAYHGWWDGVQPGVGNQRKSNDIYTLKEMDNDTLKVLETRNDIACVLINPLQAMHPNSNPPSDAMLIASNRKAHFDRQAYTQWLQQLREVCSARGIVLILDEIFVGFRLAYRGAQEYFSIQADMVTYGKTLGGGLPVGVVCGKHNLMKRYKEHRPTHICFARGTFNSHPLVMASMNRFLTKIQSDDIQSQYKNIDQLWNNRVTQINNRLRENDLPIKIVNMVSVWTILFTVPSRYNWMLQFYLRAQSLSISWIGSARLILSHEFSDEDFAAVEDNIISAAQQMKDDGWWWHDGKLTNKSIKRQIALELINNIFTR